MNKDLAIGLGIGLAIVTTYELLNKDGSFLITKGLDPKVEDPELNKKYNFDILPDGKNNYRSAQLVEKDLAYVIKKYNIKHIIRMNADNADGKHLLKDKETTRDSEKRICESLGCDFNFINAHEGYKKGEGYVGSLNKITPILLQGNTLIHCAHGADRTGGMVGGYLKKTGVLTNKDALWQYTTKYNSWNNLIKNNKFFGYGYDKYADTFYPINELTNSKWVKK